MNVHIYRADWQPAQNFVDRCGPRPRRFRSSPRRVRTCQDCGRRRWLANLFVQVYYDQVRIFCRDRDACDRARKR